MKTILITGVNGFVGKHLAREISARGHNVVGLGHAEDHADLQIKDIVKAYIRCDITQPDQVNKLPLQDIDCVINLAGLANVGASFDNPKLYMDVNVKVLSVLGSELLTSNPGARMIAVSTGALYDPNQPMPLNEQSKSVIGGSPYAQSKLAMENAAVALRKKGLDCIVVRPFNHIGPGQGLGFLIPDLAQKLQSIDPAHPQITAGNLKTTRDYTDVRDIVKAYADLAEATSLGNALYNVCSGTGKSGEDIVRALCRVLKIDFARLHIETDPSLIRPTDPAEIVGDNSLLQQDTNWQPTILLGQTVQDIVDSLK
jgi:GDP-4-dehydro-6-deoxy-D-mannose reductase